MSTAVGPIATSRPETVKWAVILIVAQILVGYLFFITPSGDDTPGSVVVIGTVFNALTLAFTWGLWNLRKWGAIGTFVVVLLNTIAALPGLIFLDDLLPLVELAFIIGASVVALVLIAHRRSRAAYH
jgi:hypothetical protein